MRKITFPLCLLLLFWLFVSLRGQGDADVQEFAAVAEATNTVDQPLSSPNVVGITVDQMDFAGLMNDYLAVFGILVASVILALRRRAHLVFGQRHRRR